MEKKQKLTILSVEIQEKNVSNSGMMGSSTA